ncbi:MAG: hypothetical protein IIB73_08225 [Proteobacteria bacterium]|nr:hypothetical protein [Pseudomonadota bacterium]
MISTALSFYFKAPEVKQSQVAAALPGDTLKKTASVVAQCIDTIENHDKFLTCVKKRAKQEGVGFKELFSFLRLALMGATKGPGIKDLLEMLGTEQATKRIRQLL